MFAKRRRGSIPASPAGAAHLVSAIILAILIAAIYGAISWGMFLGSGDYRVHIDLAQRFYNTGRPFAPHFLYHALIAALFAMHLAPSLLCAGRLILVACYLIIPFILYGFLRTVLRDSSLSRPAYLFIAGLTILLAQPITLAHAYALGYFWPEPYQIPTSTLLKPFALAGFICAVHCLSRGGRTDMRLAAVFAFVTAVGSLSKPSFLICVAPAAAFLMIYRLLRHLPVSVTGLFLGLYLPTVGILGWQLYATYSGHGPGGMYHDAIVWAPLKFMSYWATGLLWKFLLSICFPLAATALYWKSARADPMAQLAWLTFMIGAFYSYMLAERVHWDVGNLTWSGNIAAFTLFVGTAVFWLREVSAEPRGRWFRGRAAICGALLVLHALSGARLDWLYLTHYGCRLDFRAVEFVCGG
ncbi:MAG: hypothetical protein ACLP59_10975 [Bryobacteraceae bacterium]